MKIYILPWVNTKTYVENNKFSISFIEDLKKQAVYCLKGEISDLWQIIVRLQNIDKILKWAKANNKESKIIDFISELQQKKLIETNVKNPNKQKKKYLPLAIKKNIKNFVFIEKIQSKIAARNNLISTLYLTLNYKCNLKCKHCCNPHNMNEYEISYQIAKKLIDEAADIGASEICLTGGESTINKDFIKIAKYIRKKHLKLYIFTNGQKLYDDKEFFSKVVNLYPTTIQISLYSMNPDIHDNITNASGSCFKTIETIKKLREKNIDVLIACFQMKYNKDEDKSVRKFAKSVGARFLSGCTFINNKQNENITAKLNTEDIKNYYINNIDIKKYRNKLEKNDELICSAGVDKISISPNLDINPCIYFSYKLGNYNFQSLKEIKYKIIPQFHKKFITKNLSECFHYDYCEFCNYCPTYTSYENNNFMCKSSILCEDAKAYKEALIIKKKQSKEV